MSFDQPAWLLFGLFAIPILALHLRRRRRVVVSSTFVWARVFGGTSTRSSRRAPFATLLLLLQLLALALVVLALARPRFAGRPPDHWIVVVDASGGMQASDVAPSRLAAARQYLQGQLRRDFAGGGGPRRVSIVAMGAVPEVLGARLRTLGAAEQATTALSATAAEADWGQLSRILPGLTRSGERTAVTLLTDPSDESAADAAIAAALGNVKVRDVSFAGEAPSNLGLTTLSVTPAAGGKWRIQGAVRRFAGTSTTTRITVLFTTAGSQGALPWTTVPVTLATDGTGSFETELKLPAPGTLEVRLPKDDLASDNQGFYVLRAAPRQVKVLEVGPGDAALERALTSIGNVKVYRAPSLPRSLSDYDLVVIDGVRVDRRPDKSTWWLDTPPPGVSFGSPLAGPTASAWQPDHPLSRTVDWTVIHVQRADSAPRLPGADVLLEASGHPLVQARTTPQGREVFSTFALQDSNWPTLTSFPAFVYDLVRWVAPDLGQAVATPCRAGRACPLDPSLITAGTTLLDPGGAPVALPDPWVTPLPGGTGALSQAWLAAGLGPLFRPRRPGVYTLVKGGVPYPVAVNAWGSAFSALDGGSKTSANVARMAPPAWKVLLALAMLILFTEAWLAGGPPLPWFGRRGRTLPHRWRLWGWRLVALGLMALALVDPPVPWPHRSQQTVLITDNPALYAAPQAAVLRHLRRAAGAQQGGGSQLGVVSLGARPAVTSDIGASWRPAQTPALATWPGADLGDALMMATGMLARGRPGRVVVAASAVATGGGVGDALALARARGVPVDVLPLTPSHPGDASVDLLQATPDVYPRVPFTVHGVIRSEVPQRATLRVLEDGSLEEQRSVELSAGSNDIQAKLTADNSGPHTVTMEVSAAQDGYAANNRDALTVDVRPEPKVALITEQPARARVLVDALAQQGVKVTVLSPFNAPWDVQGWLAYDSAILMDVPAIDLHSTQQAKLEAWVRDDGGGLIILGGANSYGPGGYFDTAIERMSPLSSMIPRQAPQVALEFVLDRSGSMQQLVGDVSRLGIAKSATVDAVKLLNPASLAGVIVFDTKASTIVPLQRVSGLADLSRLLAGVHAAGGTSLYPALVEAYSELQSVKSMTKHVIVMSDGLSQSADFASILSRMRSAGITVSAVAISEEADKSFLQHIAALGKGTFHAATDVRALPSILAQEALLLSASPVKNAAVQPLWRDRKASFLDGLPDTLPPLGGYVETTAKPQANVALSGADGTPLLASWRFGLGRVIAFASQGAGPWTAAWLKVPAYAKLWSQAVRWTLSVAPHPGLNVDLVRRGDEVRIGVDAIAADGTPASGLKLTATVSEPGGRTRVTLLHRSSTGVYRAHFLVQKGGNYHVAVRAAATTSGSTPGPSASDLFVTYPARESLGAPHPGLLRAIAAATGGRVLNGSEPLFPSATPWRTTSRFLAQWWLLLALAAFLLELAMRYLSIRAWWTGLRRAWLARGRVRAPA